MDGMYLLQIVCFISLFAGSHPQNCPCPFIYDPVCGLNGQTYDNTCSAECMGMSIRCREECPCRNCPCPRNYNPVCGRDGRTYSNPCLAHCNGIYFYRQGECRQQATQVFPGRLTTKFCTRNVTKSTTEDVQTKRY